VIGFFKRGGNPAPLGPLETTVMEQVWSHGEASVREVAARLERPLAYTTVMTTLDRLYKKGLLGRRKADRAFVYSPLMTREQWEQKLVRGLLADPRRSSELLISCLVDAAAQQDEALLAELERTIRAKRRELERRKKS